nr:DGQHR domain-containing protein [Cellulosimicrobium sp. MM]
MTGDQVAGARRSHSALVVRQWLDAWDRVNYDPKLRQAKPEPFFFALSLPATTLRALAGIHRRDATSPEPRARDTNIQRAHNPRRSAEIRRYVEHGYPVSSLQRLQKDDPEFSTLQKPGWLPTAIVVNVLRPGDTRRGSRLAASDAVHLDDPSTDSEVVQFSLPESWGSPAWQPQALHPIEVIDGQHRLWAFEQDDESAQDFSFPVVAFRGLDISWQAYLFWSINIKPKKINPSLAFDLYPLLREQEWLLAGEGVMVYRESRAQELTEALWASPKSPWWQRINMLGEAGVRRDQPVTQGAFVRTLTSTFVRAWNTGKSMIGGLFGGSVDEQEGLFWPRVQQAAFLIVAWRSLADAIEHSDADWASSIRRAAFWEAGSSEPDPAFASGMTLLSTDQGVRAYSSVLNDLAYVANKKLDLRSWHVAEPEDDPSGSSLEEAIEDLSENAIGQFLNGLGEALASFDWRSAKEPNLTEDERLKRLAFRGSGGYSEFRRQLLEHLREHADNGDVAECADIVVMRSR